MEEGGRISRWCQLESSKCLHRSFQVNMSIGSSPVLLGRKRLIFPNLYYTKCIKVVE